ncbi:LacI family DNA-binding transcriptional regulator [Pseudonocardia kunmingensis]|uniref:LacI family transcriptional regulator n=1 Tax=Pseudonocardia kunmingensis TaxID=630975 RepID=A0A543E3K5_9PSEU|nr:LacI family transcriptional regulator [Pseudonocardia kunmingensis]
MVRSGRGRDGAPVMLDVAARAGVSYQTVSRVINDQPGVRGSTRERVLAAMRELGYRPSLAARSLASGRSHTIGIVATGSDLHGPVRTLRGVDEAARDAGYSVSTETLSRFDRASALAAGERLTAQGVEGIVAIDPEVDAAAALRELQAGGPLVVLRGGLDDLAAGVGFDGAAGARSAVRHLLDLGHPTVRHLAGPLRWAAARSRADGWRAALEAAGAPVHEPLQGDWSARSGYEAGHVLAADPGVSAVFAANDQMAIGLLRALHEAGRAVPGDVSVVGFDDVPEAAYLIPPLTTLRQDFADEGRRAVGMLLAQIEGAGTEPVPVRMLPDLVVRSSTGRYTPPPPAGGMPQ